MKRVIMSVALVAAVAAGYMMTGSDKSEVNMSGLTQANVEVLAQSIGIGYPCAQISKESCGPGYDDALGIIQYPDQ